MNDPLASLAELATRLVLDSISYSNPLPDWLDPYILDYDIQCAAIVRRIEAYLRGRSVPAPPTAVQVPRRDRSTKQWLIPSVNDQIVLQVATSAIVDALRERSVLDRSRVFSYSPNADPARLALNESQFSSWVRFEQATRERLAGVRMLQLDLESAFGSIDIESFLNFFRELAPPAVDLLMVMLRVFSPSGRGLPRVNDSLFFLGNVYLRVIDDVVTNHTSDWIRFLDDYRIFGRSDDELNNVLSGITHDLGPLGFRPNVQKIRLGSEREYLEAVEQIRYAKSTKEPYISAAVFDDVIEPSLLFALCCKTVDAPHELMHEGTGRYILQALRRMKTNSDIAFAQNQPHSPRAAFRRLARDPAFFDRLGKLMLDFARDGDEWRLVWSLYFINVLVPGQEQEDDDIRWPEIPDAIRRLDPVLDQLSAMREVTPIAQAWLRTIGSDSGGAPESMETYYEMNYADAGRYVRQQLRRPR
ncbi:MAG TPA: hypothetical protein VF858_05520 [Gemmatimonadaceae bacterium]